jgi:tetratricopeptide (TPR) repeat protein
MEPDGAVTKYYPFVSNETKNILESLMTNSDSYYEFVKKIGDLIFRTSVSVDIAFIGAAHAWRIQDLQLLETIRANYSESPRILAFTYPTTSLGDRMLYCRVVKEHVSSALNDTIADWFQVKLLVHQAYFCVAVIPTADTFDLLDRIRILISKNSDLECFLLNVELVEGIASSHDGDMTKALLSFMKSLELARKYNHQFLLSSCLRAVGNTLRNTNPNESIKYQEEANIVVNQLCVPQRMHEMRNDLGLTCFALGEYDLALESLLASLEVYDSGSGPDDTTSHNIANVYLEMGRYKEALEWIETSFQYHDGEGFPMMFALKAEILIRLQRFDKIEEYLDQAMKLALASGSETGIGRVHRARGIFESEMKHWPEAMSHLEEAYSYLEKTGAMIFHNSMLFELAKVELQLFKISKTVLNSESSGPWMSRLDAHAQKFNLPGIRMKAAILKAEYMETHGDVDSARNTLEDALGILDSPSVSSIREQIVQKLISLK